MTDLSRAELEERIRRSLDQVDPIGTGLDLEQRLDEYTLESAEIEKQVRRGVPIDKATVDVFKDTCEMKLDRDLRNQIFEAYASNGLSLRTSARGRGWFAQRFRRHRDR